MQVNQTISLPPSILKGVTAGERSTDQVTAVGNASMDAIKMEVVAQTFAKLEHTLLQWFFTQRPELGDAFAKLLSLQEQLSSQQASGTANSATNTDTNTANSTTNTAANTANSFVNLDGKLLKIMDMMKMLLISPKEQLAGKSDVIMQKSPQTLLSLIGELKQIQKEQSPALQAKIDNFVTKLTQLVKQMIPTVNFSDDMSFAQLEIQDAAVPGENTSSTAKNVAVKNENATTPTGGDASNVPIKDQDLPVVTEQPGWPAKDEKSAAQSLKSGINVQGNLAGSDTEPSPGSNTVAGEKSETVVLNGKEVLTAKSNSKSSGDIIRSQLAQVTEPAGLIPEEEVNTGTILNGKRTESNTTYPINKAVETQQKLQEIIRQFTDAINKHEPSGKLQEVLRDLTACVKALQINPETEWESLLRYPIIYKQTLHKALKLLQEMINTKSSDNQNLHQNVINLLSEISANLHVQNSVNQLRQENPANQTMYFQIPLQVGNEIKNGEMLVVNQREKRGNKWEIVNSWYRFYLETQYLGPVQINLHAANKQLNIQFMLTDEEQVELFNSRKLNLNEVLTRYGYEVVDITCSAGEVSPLFLFDTDNANHQCIDITV